jgi:DNA-directed RNA polymerase specialized sigma24 family protein
VEPIRGLGGHAGVGNEAVTLAAADGPDVAVAVEGPVTVALDELYRAHYAAMVRLAHLVTGSNEVAEDVVQEAFVRLHRSQVRADNPGAFLRTVVVNRCRSWQRRQVLERRHSGAVMPGVSLPVEVDETLTALAGLRSRQRTALVLRFYGDLAETDIAAALGCRPGTVKSLISRGLAQLKETIER